MNRRNSGRQLPLVKACLLKPWSSQFSNSEATLPQLFDDITGLTNSSDIDFEIVFVDDGSSDGSARVLRDLQKRGDNVVVVENKRNRCQSKATAIGISAARHGIVITLDDDMQHRPQDFSRLLAPLRNSSPLTLVIGVTASMKRPFWRDMDHRSVGRARLDRYCRSGCR